jgi:hypothetical protein
MGCESMAAMQSWLAVAYAVPIWHRSDHIEDGTHANRSRRTVEEQGEVIAAIPISQTPMTT